MLPYWYLFYLWSLFFQPHYPPQPTMAPVYWQQTMPLAPVAQPSIAAPAQYPPGWILTPDQKGLTQACPMQRPVMAPC